MDNVNNDILHSGVAHDENPPGRGSGRYAWGTGENPNQHKYDFITEVNRLRKNGYPDEEIAKILIHPNSKVGELKQLIYANTSVSTAQVNQLRAQGHSDKEIAQMIFGDWASANELKAKIAIAEKRERQEMIDKVTELYYKTVTDANPQGNKSEVARKLGISESSVRGYLKAGKDSKNQKYWETAEALKRAIDESPVGIIDISKFTEHELGVTENTKKVAVAILQEEGYVKTWVKFNQLGTGNSTSEMVLTAPPGEGETIHDMYRKAQLNKFDVSGVKEYSPDGGAHFFVPEPPSSMSSDRIYIRRASEGGADMDGVIEIRPGVKDLTLGDSRYSQVRIAVDGTHYMKGMAIYSNDIPKGYDVVYNTSKPDDWPMKGPNKNTEILKRLKDDKESPFGATIKAGGQSYYEDPKGNYILDENGIYRKAKKGEVGKYSLSPVNKINDEGDWDKWSRSLSAQFLSKQPIQLINQQLDLTVKERRSQLDEIKSLTNPMVKKKMLEDFADNCDKQASELRASGIKGQAYQVILPVKNVSENEVYAPNFKHGDTVALVRYPHAGLFEIPILKVNNKNESGKSIIGNSRDAIGINPKTAAILSGADFDGDTVICIPMKSNNIKIMNKKPLKGLIGWDFHNIYRLPDGAEPIKDSRKQTEMGKVTNLIADMTLAGAPEEDIEKAVKHSMVVIDCVKHRLDIKKSEQDNDIIALKREYQGVGKNGMPKGASTVITRAGSKDYIDERREITRESDMTPEELKAFKAGKKVYRNTGKQITMKRITKVSDMTPEEKAIFESGRKVYREVKPRNATQRIEQMYMTDDARTLVHNPENQKEMAYANFANQLKKLSQDARKAYRSIKPTPVDPKARVTYAKEVSELKDQLKAAQANHPRERRAQSLGNKMLQEKLKSNPELEFDKEHYGREKNRLLTAARAIYGAHANKIYITDNQWKAIQSNALSSSTVMNIFLKSDQDRFKQLATPKDKKKLTKSNIQLAIAMHNSGMYTNKEIAEKFGVSVSTLYEYLS